MTPTTTPTPAALAAKDRLARLMATENITVEHDPRARTASFNIETRTLTMPVWKDMPEATGDMLIAHEVSHALHTPAGMETLKAGCAAIDPRNPAVAKDYLNVVEDVRIERLMKARFPGSKTDFAKGYRWMHETDLFGLAKVETLGDLPLIDRINLQYKIGWLVEVPFAADELDLARRAATTVTWDDVVALAKEIYEFAKTQDKNRSDDSQEGESQEGESQEGESQEGEETTGSGKAPKPRTDGDETEGDETEGTEGTEGDETEGTEGDETEGDETDETDGTEGTDGDETDETDSTEGTKGTDGDETEDGTDGDEDADGKTDGDADDREGEGKAPTARTLREVEDALLGRTDTAATPTHYTDLPDVGKGFIVPRKEVFAELKRFGEGKVGTIAAEMFAAWRNENNAAVQVLATEFDRRKAADEQRRTATAETGSLDPNRLWAYKITDEIFAANAYVKDGKNHGLMVLFDLSASMGGILHDTMVQLVTLAAFARRVNIPFRFYAFTDDGSLNALGETFKGKTFGGSNVRLLELFTDGMSLAEFNSTAGLLLAATSVMGYGHGHAASARVAANWRLSHEVAYRPAWMHTIGHTPNNTALLGLSQVAREFKATKRLQVVNLVVLTDGESTDSLYAAVTESGEYAAKNYDADNPPRVVLRDKTTGKTYGLTRQDRKWYYADKMGEVPLKTEVQTALLAQVFRDRVGGKVVCIRLDGGDFAVNKVVATDKELAQARNTLPWSEYRRRSAEKQRKVRAEWNARRWWGFTGDAADGFDEYLLIATGEVAEVTLTADPTTGAGLRSLRSQFAKSLAATKGNRPLMTRVAELLAK